MDYFIAAVHGNSSAAAGGVLLTVLFIIVAFVAIMAIATRLRKCPSDQVLVIFGKTFGKKAAKCIHGGAAIIWPVIQDYGFLSLRPLQIEVNLTNALCKQNIRINVPSVFTVGISIDEAMMGNAANRLLGLGLEEIKDLAKDIIFGQLRLVIASMTIEQINSDRETFLRNIEQNVAEELNKIGLQLLNVNITDITDESGYIDAIGKRAAAEAINKARVDVAEEERKGGIGEAEARRDQRIAVSNAEAAAQAGEANANRDRRVAIKQADASAIEGENVSAIEIAKSNAARIEQEAEAFRRGEVAKKVADADIKKANYDAERIAELARAELETARQKAEIIVKAEIEKEQTVICAEAEAEKIRREAQGEADAIFAKLEAEAKGNYELLKAKGDGFKEIIGACGGNPEAASSMLIIEKLNELVKLQTEAIKNIKIDKVTVWDSGTGKNGKNSTADFMSGMIGSIPPLRDVAKMAGLELPEYLGRVREADNAASESPAEQEAQ